MDCLRKGLCVHFQSCTPEPVGQGVSLQVAELVCLTHAVLVHGLGSLQGSAGKKECDGERGESGERKLKHLGILVFV